MYPTHSKNLTTGPQAESRWSYSYHFPFIRTIIHTT